MTATPDKTLNYLLRLRYAKNGDVPFFDRFKNDVFLEDPVLTVCSIAMFKDVNPSNRRCLKQESVKRLKIRALTETSRSDCYEFTARAQELLLKGEQARENRFKGNCNEPRPG
jgi:hypothetical protein